MGQTPYELPDQLLLSRGRPADLEPIRVQILPPGGLHRPGLREATLRRRWRRWSPWLITGACSGLLAGLLLAAVAADRWTAQAAITAPKPADVVLSESLLTQALVRLGPSQSALTVPVAGLPASWNLRRRIANPGEALRGLADAIRIRAIGQETFLLEATVSDPATAAPLANAIAAEWQSGFQASQRAIAKAVAEQLAPAIARQTTRLADAEAALTAFLRPYRYTLRDPARLPAEAAVQVDELRAAIDSERRALRALQDRVRDAELTAAATAARAAVLPAVKPVKQSSARKLWFPLVGLLSGLVAGLAAAGVRDLLRHCLRDPGESQRLLGLPELGVIPTSQSHPSWESAFRNLLSMLWLSGAGQKRPRVVVLISPRGRAGVSTITCQLGVTLATTNRRVLLVDANLASPYLHRFFSMDNEYGLADVLSEEKPVEEYFFSQLAQETGVPGLYLLPAGSATARPGALAQLERLHDLLVRFRLEFHAVLIDAGAALASPDARLLARMADGAIQVHRAGRTTREQALESLHRLQDDGTAVFGTILNGADVPVA